ncbi:MAG: phage antirepressor KilAC domain-containing protein [Clostridia bacterium]|nr:phage antirepressor KilAC domain-containing protein [Clostridia bacterium]
MNNMKVFNSQKFGQVRSIEENGKILFVGSDIASALGYKVPHKAIYDHCKGVLKRNIPTNGGQQEMNVIPEGDIYRLAAKSELPGAEEFESWIFDEVIPSIRKTGAYLSPVIDSKMLYQIAAQLEEKERQIAQRDSTIAALTPAANLGNAMRLNDGLILIRDFVKILTNAGVKMKQADLFTWLIKNGYLYRKKNGDYIPYKDYIDQGLFRVLEMPVETKEHRSFISFTTKITGKGQEYFINKLKEAYSLCLQQ